MAARMKKFQPLGERERQGKCSEDSKGNFDLLIMKLGRETGRKKYTKVSEQMKETQVGDCDTK